MKTWSEVQREMLANGVPRSVMGYCKLAFDAGERAERFKLHEKLDDLSVWCEAVQDHIIYCEQVDKMIDARNGAE